VSTQGSTKSHGSSEKNGGLDRFDIDYSLEKETAMILMARKLLFKNSYNTMGHHHPKMKKGIVLMDQQGIFHPLSYTPEH